MTPSLTRAELDERRVALREKAAATHGRIVEKAVLWVFQSRPESAWNLRQIHQKLGNLTQVVRALKLLTDLNKIRLTVPGAKGSKRRWQYVVPSKLSGNEKVSRYCPGGPWPPMTTRAATVLELAGIRSVRELSKLTEQDLLRLKNCGRRTSKELLAMTGHSSGRRHA